MMTEYVKNNHEICGRPIKSPGIQRRIWGGGPISTTQWPWLGIYFFSFFFNSKKMYTVQSEK